MPKIDRPEKVSVTYSPEDIVKLILTDLVEQHGISADATDIHVMISGGRMYDANAAYSGGFGQDWQCDPVVFNGFSAVGKDVRK